MLGFNINKDRLNIVRVDFLGIDIQLVFDANQYLDITKYDEDISDDSFGGHIHMEDNKIVILVKDDVSNDEMKEVLLHETSHCVSFIMEEHGIEDDEFRSYLLTYIYKELNKFFPDFHTFNSQKKFFSVKYGIIYPCFDS